MNDKEYGALKDKLSSLSWDFPAQSTTVGAGGDQALTEAMTAGQLALTNGEVGVPEAVWLRVTDIVEKMSLVDKVAAKKFDQLSQLADRLDQGGRRLLNEMEDSLMALEDEKNSMVRLQRYKKTADCICKCLWQGVLSADSYLYVNHLFLNINSSTFNSNLVRISCLHVSCQYLFRFLGLDYRVWSLYRVWGFGYRVQVLGFRVY